MRQSKQELSESLTPTEIVEELNKYVVGQHKAKRSVAIAMRNRWRRLNVQSELKEEILPNNIIMIGPTGVGKTEIARRLANLAGAPFIKVEASKYTEVGYVGRDVESMVRDLMELAVSMVREERRMKVRDKAEELAEARILDYLLPAPKTDSKPGRLGVPDPEADKRLERFERTREKLRKQLREGQLDGKLIEIKIQSSQFPVIEIFGPMGIEEIGPSFQEMFSGMIPKKTKRRKVTIAEARKIFVQEEAEKLIDMESVVGEAKARAENSGIIFVDEIDKIAGAPSKTGPDVSREGVQRDILPIVEGSNVMTKYGMVRTDHILFIAAGAFHSSKPSDLIPELQGRFPIRVELENLSTEDFERILIEPRNALIRQYTALMETEGVNVKFTKGAIKEIAQTATLVNSRTENIGARRLHTIISTLLEDIMFEAPEGVASEVKVTREMVRKRLAPIVKHEDLSRYIL